MNLAEFRSAVAQRCGEQLAPEALDVWVQQALDAVAAERDWPWLMRVETVVSDGSGVWQLPAEWVSSTSVICGERLIPPGDVESAARHSSELPMWFVDGGNLVVVPAPHVGVQVVHRFVCSERRLMFEADVPLLPSRFNGAVVALAASFALDRSGDAKRAATLRDEYFGWLRRMRRVARSRPLRIVPRPVPWHP